MKTDLLSSSYRRLILNKQNHNNDVKVTLFWTMTTFMAEFTNVCNHKSYTADL